MKIILRETMYLSTDGVHTFKHEAGKVYEATSAHHKRLFEHLIETGKADAAVESVPTEGDKPKVQTKKETK
jgi:hypothetical protein